MMTPDEQIRQYQQQLEAERLHRRQLEQKLAQALAAAEAAGRAKHAFIANMSHELHTPLGAILGFTEMVLEDIALQQFESLEYDLRRIQQAGMRLLALLNELLDLSKMETNKMELSLAHFDLKAEVEEMVAQLRPVFQTQNNQFSLHIAEQLPPLWGDVQKTRHVLWSLLDNATKFTVEGEISLTVQPTLYKNQPYIQFIIQDSGIGMTPAQVANAFEAFTQADGSSTRHYEGTGLGLYICQQLCHLMQGEIAVESEIGRGTTFTVWLPQKLVKE